ncbi:MAG: lamin tail domain-containing protein [Candidatus Krumholzibacteria bacterium]|nr:lamin tail domain-containing protein [Candidatus Krumholzibacteria bacterium]
MMWWSLFCFRAFPVSILSILFLSFDAFPCTGVVINEVYYDHPGKDSGWEFVELYNASEDTCDLDGWSLEFLDGASLGKTTIWSAGSGTRVGPGEFLCIAGSLRDPAPALLLDGTLGNGPDAVRLVSPSGVADLVGYGACSSSDLYETNPAADVAAGSSLARKPDGFDSDRNDADFVASSPTPGRRNFFLHDVSVGLEAAALPCRGYPFSMRIVIENRGIEPFEARLSIVAETVERGSVVFSKLLALAVDLAPCAADSAAVSFIAPEALRFEIQVRLEGAPDENPANDTAAVSLASSPGAIVINEIMYRPDEGMSEWIELKNGSPEACDLGSWTICDATGSKRLVSAGDFPIPPGGLAILARDSSSFMREFPACRAPVRGLVGALPSLNDSEVDGVADIVELFDSEGVLVERIAYGALIGSERGRSIERISADVCSARSGGIWHRCAAPTGSTPGEENSTRVETMRDGKGIVISPNPFCLRRDGEASITGKRARDETGFLVRVFSLEGFEVRRIFGEREGSLEFSCRWDGRANDGSCVRTGLYVCLVEFTGAGGGVCRKEKTCIAVVGN